MYLRPHRLLHLQRTMHVLAASLSADELRRELAGPLLGLLDADFYVSYVWDEAAGQFTRGIAHNLAPVHGERYESQFQFDDPITSVLKARRVPTRVSDVLSQRALQSTPFFHDFLRPDGLHWGVNAYAHDGHRHLGDLRIWRRRGRPDFDADDLALLRTVYPALVSALGRAHGTRAAQAGQVRAEVIEHLVSRCTLSRREAEIAALAGEGLPDKEIARTLGIGFTTVRTHLAAVFRKLGCKGRTQLARRLAQDAGRLAGRPDADVAGEPA